MMDAGAGAGHNVYYCYYSGVDPTNYLDNDDVINGKVIGTYPAKIENRVGFSGLSCTKKKKHSTWFTYFDAKNSPG